MEVHSFSKEYIGDGNCGDWYCTGGHPIRTILTCSCGWEVETINFDVNSKIKEHKVDVMEQKLGIRFEE